MAPLNLVANPRFVGWPSDAVTAPDNLQELCPHWFVEYAPGSDSAGITFERSSVRSGAGMRIRVATSVPWIRVWQRIHLGGLDSPQRRLRLNVTSPKVANQRLTFDRAVILREKTSGRRVFARRIRQPKPGDDDWSTLGADFSVEGLPPDESYYLALQFSGQGRIALKSCELSVVAPPSTTMNRRRRVAVVGWELSHNPAGRAYVLGDLASQGNTAELVGPLFPNFGGVLWPPIAEQDRLPIRTFPAHDLRSLVDAARSTASQVRCDVVLVSKPRLPSLLLGCLIKQANDCAMIVDVDDQETSFFPPIARPSVDDLLALSRSDPARVTTPYSDAWTSFSEGLVAAADAVTVSNHTLQQSFGGTIVRHARDERRFDPALHDREAVRAEFGYGPSDRIVLFLGTPRPHKGVFAIADTMERLALENLALCVIGSMSDRRVSSRFNAYDRARIALHPDEPWARLPELVNMADAVMVLQDPASPISEHQIPAKLTDALAMGVPVYATPVPPLADLIAAGVIAPVADDVSLETALREIAGSPATGLAVGAARGYFLSELSYAANSCRLDRVLDEATRDRQEVAPALDELFDLLETLTGRRLPRFAARPALREHRRGRFRSTDGPRDVVYLWKQNDSDIYGRRVDMLTRYLLRSGHVRRILHFDAPITPASLERHLDHARGAVAHQGNLVYVNTVRRALNLADESDLFRRTFIHRSGARPERFLGQELPDKDGYPDFIRRSLDEAGIGKNPLLIVSPIVPDYATVRDVVDPAVIIADIVDDQRQWPTRNDEQRRKLTAEYEAILGDAEIVTCNCEPVRERFASLRDDVHVVPNGMETFPGRREHRVPDDLARLPRPIIGYVGNLRDRIDFDLVRKIAEDHPTGSIVLIGSAHDSTHVDDLADVSNLHFLGVRPYDEAVHYIRAFDVAIMPHLSNELTRSMNPLKLYVYVALAVPVVSTAVPNIADVAAGVNVAATHAEFLEQIRRVLAGEGVQLSPSQRQRILSRSSWKARVETLWGLLDFVA
jgi:glycosyltransferase involved in cell wall biosynthesis